MANANVPRGLVPEAFVSGAPYNGAVNVYYVPATNATALYIGDPVIGVTNSADANGVPTVNIASAGGGTYLLGAMMGVANNAGSLVIPVLQSQPVYLPASTAAYIYVADDPNLVWRIQENGAMVAGAGGRNADLVSGAGSTVTGLSGWQLASSTLNTTNTLQMRVLRLYQSATNTNAIGTNAKWLCKINLHSLNNLTGI